MRKLLSVALLLTIFLAAETINLNKGWNLVASSDSVDVSKIANSNTLVFWRWQNGWQAYSCDGNIQNLLNEYNITTFSTTNPNEGFWVYAINNTVLDLNISVVEEGFKFTQDFLSGKTLYIVTYDDFGYDGDLKWNAVEMVFESNGSMIWTEIDTPETNPYTTTYSVDSNNILHIFEEDGGDELIALEKTDDYIFAEMIDGDDKKGVYLFFDKDNALEFRDNQNSKLESLKFTKEFLVGRTIYADFEDSYIKAHFTDTQMKYEEYNKTTGSLIESGSEDYYIKDDGSIEAGEDNFKLQSIDKLHWKLEVLCTCDDDGDGVKETSETHIWYLDSNYIN